MKRILAIAVFCLSAAVSAKENITITYAWGPGDSVANYHRTIANEANKVQNKYNFIFDTKPGAGGAIASNYVLKENNNIYLNILIVIFTLSIMKFTKPDFKIHNK
jgi:tripartite-type tricarboxylate transporter receptor subunit TctC